MTETTQEFRDAFRRQIEKDGDADIYPGELIALFNDADRLAQYERDLHDGFEDRSQDADWLRAGFLQRGAEIERLRDGIRALADKWDDEDCLDPRFAFTPPECAQQARDLLGEDGE